MFCNQPIEQSLTIMSYPLEKSPEEGETQELILSKLAVNGEPIEIAKHVLIYAYQISRPTIPGIFWDVSYAFEPTKFFLSYLLQWQ